MQANCRESKLTSLLQDSLGGTARTLLLACINPAEANAAQSKATLEFAQRASKVQLHVTEHEAPAKEREDYEALKRELARQQESKDKFQNGIKDILVRMLDEVTAVAASPTKSGAKVG